MGFFSKIVAIAKIGAIVWDEADDIKDRLKRRKKRHEDEQGGEDSA